MKISILTIFLLLLCIGINPIFSWRRRRRRRSPPPCYPVNCQVGSWSAWSSCSHHCGTSGTQNRRRQKTSSAQCGGQCPYHLVETQACHTVTAITVAPRIVADVVANWDTKEHVARKVSLLPEKVGVFRQRNFGPMSRCEHLEEVSLDYSNS